MQFQVMSRYRQQIFIEAMIWVSLLEEEGTPINQAKFLQWLWRHALHVEMYRCAVQEVLETLPAWNASRASDE